MHAVEAIARPVSSSPGSLASRRWWGRRTAAAGTLALLEHGVRADACVITGTDRARGRPGRRRRAVLADPGPGPRRPRVPARGGVSARSRRSARVVEPGEPHGDRGCRRATARRSVSRPCSSTSRRPRSRGGRSSARSAVTKPVAPSRGSRMRSPAAERPVTVARSGPSRKPRSNRRDHSSARSRASSWDRAPARTSSQRPRGPSCSAVSGGVSPASAARIWRCTTRSA
jgi:hypothetical protein